MYSKVKRRFEKIGFLPLDIRTQPEQFEELLVFLAKITRDNEMTVQACAQELIGTKARIGNGKCIDDVLINSICSRHTCYQKDRGQRQGCSCHKSIDIGQYGTCGLNCLYCYAR